MPQPFLQQVHVQAALTQIATAYIQDQTHYVADQVFANVPVEHQTDKYFMFSKDDFYRDEAQERADDQTLRRKSRRQFIPQDVTPEAALRSIPSPSHSVVASYT